MAKNNFDLREGADGKFPSASFILEDMTVGFAQITGEGRKGKSKEFEYLMAVEMEGKDKKTFIKQINELWESAGFGKAAKPEYDPASWFTADEGKSECLWISEKVEKLDLDNFYERAPDTDFTMKQFAKMGAGSVVNLGIRAFIWSNENGKGVSIVPTVVQLKEFTKYSGGAATSLGGTKLGDEGVNTSSEKKDKKKKKKKKEKK